jgi:putative flippase GtrA
MQASLIQFLKFSGIGVINTLIHLILVMLLVELFSVHPVIANTIAFLIANAFSYWANSRWSFQVALSQQHFIRFFLVSCIGLLLTITLTSLAHSANWHYLIGVALVFCGLPLLTFLSHRYWTYAY